MELRCSGTEGKEGKEGQVHGEIDKQNGKYARAEEQVDLLKDSAADVYLDW